MILSHPWAVKVIVAVAAAADVTVSELHLFNICEHLLLLEQSKYPIEESESPQIFQVPFYRTPYQVIEPDQEKEDVEYNG